MNTLFPHSDVQRRNVLKLLLIALALGFGQTCGASEQDACALYQQSFHLTSQLSAADAGEAGPSLLQKQVHATKVLAVSFSEVLPAAHLNASGIPMSLSRQVNITRNANETIKINVTDDASGKVVNVTDNTSDVKIKHKVVKSRGKKHVIRSHVRTRQGNATSAPADSWQKYSNGKNQTQKPFAKTNVTTHRRVVNITRRVNATHNRTQNVTITDTVETVDLSSPSQIASIYMLLFVPVGVAWSLYFHHGMLIHHFFWLLPFTMCAMNTGQDLVNQSLTLILNAPNAISAIQGFSMCLTTGIWMVLFDLEAVRKVSILKLQTWMIVAVLFAIYQLTNHWVYAACSLSERTVITNMSPLFSLTLEKLVMPVKEQSPTSFGGNLALALMVLGAILFSIQAPSFTSAGIGAAVLSIVAQIPYRLAQRHFLFEGHGLPLSLLACIDGFVLGVPSVLISYNRNLHFWNVVEMMTYLPVLMMLLMSVLTFVGLHLCGLALLRAGSATSYLVFSNIAGLVTVALGIIFFGDNALATTLACIGLATNVGSGIWYSAEVHHLEDLKGAYLNAENVSEKLPENIAEVNEGAN